MTTIGTFTIILCFIVFLCVFLNIRAKKTKSSIDRRCVHTKLDCENCIDFIKCPYKYDPSCLVKTKGDD